MKKIQIIEAITDWFSSDQAGEHRARYHHAIIQLHLNSVFNQIIYDTWLNGKRYSDFGQLDGWSRTYTLNIQNQVGTRGYVLLPFAPVQLPDNAGIRQVRSAEEYTEYGEAIGAEHIFAPIEATAGVVFAELEVDDMDDTPTFRIEQNNYSVGEGEASHILKLEKLPTGVDQFTAVDVMMITPIEELGDYDDVAIPSGADETLITKVIEVMRGKPKPDTANDNVVEL